MGQRLRYTEESGCIDVEVDARPGRYVIAAMGLWLSLWLAGEVLIVHRMAVHPAPAADPFLVVTLCAWSLSGAVGAFRALARCKRRERIRLTPTHLHYRREYPWFRRVSHFQREQVTKLCAVASAMDDPLQVRGTCFWGFDACGIQFQYRGAVYRIASQLERRDSEALASRLLAALMRDAPPRGDPPASERPRPDC